MESGLFSIKFWLSCLFQLALPFDYAYFNFVLPLRAYLPSPSSFFFFFSFLSFFFFFYCVFIFFYYYFFYHYVFCHLLFFPVIQYIPSPPPPPPFCDWLTEMDVRVRSGWRPPLRPRTSPLGDARFMIPKG